MFVDRIQSIARMSIEFCSKMRALGVELNAYPGSGGETENGFVIPVVTHDTGDDPVQEFWFVGPKGFFAPYVDDAVGLPLLDTLEREGIVEPLKEAMTDVLLGRVRVVGGRLRAPEASAEQALPADASKVRDRLDR